VQQGHNDMTFGRGDKGWRVVDLLWLDHAFDVVSIES